MIKKLIEAGGRRCLPSGDVRSSHDRPLDRVTFYYLLAEKYGKLSMFS